MPTVKKSPQGKTGNIKWRRESLQGRNSKKSAHDAEGNCDEEIAGGYDKWSCHDARQMDSDIPAQMPFGEHCINYAFILVPR